MDQQPNQRIIGRPFPSGTSGNVSGLTTLVRLRREFTAKFIEVNKREPGTLELTRIDSLAFAMVRLRRRGNTSTEVAALGNLVDRLTARLFEGVPFIAARNPTGKGLNKTKRVGRSLGELEGRGP